MSETSTPDPAVRAMRLRAEPPKPLRLSRKVALAGAAGLAVAVAAAAVVGLSTQDDAAPAQELTPSSAPPPEAVRALPGDYAAPRLGPPLPGDLGRPILSARNAADADSVSSIAGSDHAASARDADAREADRARRHAEADAARTSALMIAQGGGRSVEEADVARGGPTQGPATVPSAPAIGALRLRAGSIIEAGLVTGVQSDLPGPVLGQITADVHDSETGRRLLIPKGSRLIGGYSAQIAQRQSRLQVVWTRIVLPDGRSIGLEDQAASDTRGYAGLQDRTDSRWGERLRSAALTTLLAISGAAVDVEADDRLARALRDGATDGVDTLGRGLVERGLSIPPRLTLRPGLTFRIILNRDLDLVPYGD
nr:TrbI/VirB10 family protein [uncultured Brevundimonas sp.]